MFQTPNISKPPKTQQFYAILAIQTLLFKQTMKTQDPATGSARLRRHFEGRRSEAHRTPLGGREPGTKSERQALATYVTCIL